MGKGEGNGHPLQYSCLENLMDGGAWQATVHGVARVRHDLATKPPPPLFISISLSGLAFPNQLEGKTYKDKCILEEEGGSKAPVLTLEEDEEKIFLSPMSHLTVGAGLALSLGKAPSPSSGEQLCFLATLRNSYIHTPATPF